jgi:uncharacterized OB-fold protein
MPDATTAETGAETRPDRTLGPGHDEFWAFCDKGELRVQQCQGCGKLLWPVMRACDGCGGGAFDWAAMSGRGKIISWTTFVQDYYRGMIAVPYDTILVELDEGPLFIANPDGFGEAEITPGMPVTVRFRACRDSAGPFNLPVFARA